ncbi:MAG: sulfotransferase [Chloroflexota bacterium]
MHPRIFIGGTGRSGTTILYRALGCHKNIYALPKEMRFVTEPDGVINLVDALTTRYSTNQSREALFKFERLMGEYMCDPQNGIYPNYNMPEWIGEEYYYKRLTQFCDELVDFKFRGISAPLRPEKGEMGNSSWRKQFKDMTKLRRNAKGDIPQFKFPHRDISVVKYFPERQEMLQLAAQFVDDLFMHVAEKHGKQTWCEKTPTNLQSIDFLWELFPDAAFIHMIRDPRGVLESMRKVRWAPDDTRELCFFLSRIYDRWFDVKQRVDVGQYRFLEIKLEHLTTYPIAALEKIADLCELPNEYVNLPDISPEKVNGWQSQMSAEDLKIVNNLLGEYIVRLGYTV